MVIPNLSQLGMEEAALVGIVLLRAIPCSGPGQTIVHWVKKAPNFAW